MTKQAFEWRVSSMGDITIVKITNLSDGTALSEVTFHLPWQAVRLAMANIKNPDQGCGSRGEIDTESLERGWL